MGFVIKKEEAKSDKEPVNPAKDPNLIRVYDAYGRTLYIPKETWRTSVLPDMIKTKWSDPDQLYPLLVQALTDGFRAEIAGAVDHLYEIDTDHGRAACLLAILRMEEGRLTDAETVLKSAITRVGEQGYLFTNLAKIYEKRNEYDRAKQALWRALEIDPNQENAFSWYWAKQKEREGEEAGIEAVRQVAAIPASWRPQLWLARFALEKQDLPQALALYDQALSRCSRPAPTHLLMQMSGDLGNAGRLSELLALVEPQFVPSAHGLMVGNNLIKAHLDLGQLEAARRILDQLYALGRPDYQENLSSWDTAIAKARTEKSSAPVAGSIGMLSLPGPVWLAPNSEGADLFPTKKTTAALICILGCSAERADAPDAPRRQLADAVGRTSRSVPLFLAEQIAFRSDARVVTLIPWVTEKENAGFVLSGRAWSDNEAIEYVKRGELGGQYVVTVHIDSTHEPWSLNARVMRVDDGKLLASFRTTMSSGHPENAVPQLATLVLNSLAGSGAVRVVEAPSLYRVPTDTLLADYLLRLEQLLAIRCAAMDSTRPGFLNNEREIIEGDIRLCVECPDSFVTRLLLAKSLLALSRIRPEIMAEFTAKLDALGKDKPLAGRGREVIASLIAKALTKR